MRSQPKHWPQRRRWPGLAYCNQRVTLLCHSFPTKSGTGICTAKPSFISANRHLNRSLSTVSLRIGNTPWWIAPKLLGWAQDRVEVIDEDQGHSGQTAAGRLGFQYLLAEIGLDHIGIIFGLEMSRLACSNKDWHQLLELCAIFRTLLADQDGVYDPTDYNDRLLLGLKGTLSEAELHILRSRMYQGLLNKAKRGEVFNHPPLGYIKLPTGEFALDPDEQVQGVVRLLFAEFERQGTLHGLLRLSGPTRHPPSHSPAFWSQSRSKLEWRRPNRVTLQNLLRRPLYAGYYQWGHRAVDPRRKIAGRPATGRTVRKPEECLVLLKDRCPAYITVAQYWANQQRLDANSTAVFGATRNGPSLLGGLLGCGRCGRAPRWWLTPTPERACAIAAPAVLSTTPSRSARVCRGSAWTRSFANRSWRHSSRRGGIASGRGGQCRAGASATASTTPARM